MDTIKIFSANFFEKKCVFPHNNLLNSTIFAERERERLATDTLSVAFWCARTLKIIATTLFSQCCGFFVSGSYYYQKINLY